MALTEDGLTVLRQPEILAAIETALQQDVNADITLGDDTLLGQLSKVFSLQLAEGYSLLELLYSVFDLDAAEGVYLDNLVRLIGITRRQGDKTSGTQYFTGEDGTIIPRGRSVSDSVGTDEYSLTSAVTITTTNCVSATYELSTVLNSTQYTITIGTTDVSFTSDSDAIATEILAGLESAVNSAGISGVTATSTATSLTIDSTSSVRIVSINYLSPTSVTSAGNVEANEIGSKTVLANTLTKIVNPISGWSSTTNPSALTTGSEDETDEELRQRAIVSQQNVGGSTVPAITDRVLEIEGVTTAFIIENDTTAVDSDGRPAKSFELTVVGGDNDVIAQTLWNAKPAGIQTHGSISVVFDDDLDISRTVSFSRPTTINYAFRITVTTYSEEDLPTDPADIIKETVKDYVDTLNLGNDLITGRIKGPIYSAVSGLDTITVEYQRITNSGDSPTGSWLTVTDPIELNEIASTQLVDIQVSGV